MSDTNTTLRPDSPMNGIRCPRNGYSCISPVCVVGSAINCQYQPVINPVDPIREQIERDAEKWRNMPTVMAKNPPYSIADMDDLKDANISGRWDQDKMATNRTVDAVIKEMKLNSWRFDSDDDLIFFISELEKLRRV